MAHSHERKEKVCLNCNADLYGRYCHACGQENLEPKETLWQFIKSVFKSLTQFDSKLLKSLRYLLLKPGFLTVEYTKGRRVGYQSPLGLYFYISALFFVILFSVFTTDNEKTPVQKNVTGTSITKGPTTIKDATAATINTPQKQTFEEKDSTIEAYTARQAALPEAQRDNIVMRYIHRKSIAGNIYIYKHPNSFRKKIKTNLQQAFPKVFFISLPVFALILYILYFRRRDDYNYVSHLIFSLHFYCATFILLASTFGLFKLAVFTSFTKYVGFAIIACLFVYEFIAMRRFYQQGWVKTSIKYLAINIVFITMTSVLTLLAVLDAVLNLG